MTHYLSNKLGGQSCVNLGLAGAHPLALEGLVDYYCGSIRGKKVVLHCNPLWLSSPRTDLQDPKLEAINHPRLVPQFLVAIPSYKEEISPRIGIVVERHVALSSWTNHLQQAYFDRSDIPSWTLEHPYDNPLGPLTRIMPIANDAVRHLPEPWYKSGAQRQDYAWVDLETSLQWAAFRRVVATLRERGNNLFVVVGPFNEHMLTPASLERYRTIKAGIADWLQAQQVAHVVPPPLPSEQYGDASHPLAAGYALLAGELLEEAWFRQKRVP